MLQSERDASGTVIWKPKDSDKEAAYLRQCLDCNCNDCSHMLRDMGKLQAHKKSYEGTGLMDNLQFGQCSKFDNPVSFSPNTCQLETQECFKHRKDK